MAGMSLRSAVLIAPIAVITLTAASPAVSHAAPSSAAATTKNANFKGKWDMNSGYTFTIERENAKTGTCKGTSSYGHGYRFGQCKVRGHHFKFRITAKSDGAYSNYRGKFKTHSLHGIWTPEGSHGETFTATRAKVK
jgi:hypothetical protein